MAQLGLSNVTFQTFIDTIAPKARVCISYSNLPSKTIKTKWDTKDTSYLFYKDKVVKITKSKIEFIAYKDLPDHILIWKSAIINRKIGDELMFNTIKDGGDFELFMQKQVDTMKHQHVHLSAYMIHNYKTSHYKRMHSI